MVIDLLRDLMQIDLYQLKQVMLILVRYQYGRLAIKPRWWLAIKPRWISDDVEKNIKSYQNGYNEWEYTQPSRATIRQY